MERCPIEPLVVYTFEDINFAWSSRSVQVCNYPLKSGGTDLHRASCFQTPTPPAKYCKGIVSQDTPSLLAATEPEIDHPNL